MMTFNNILLFGATGSVGKSIAAELKNRGYKFSCVVRNRQRAWDLAHLCSDIIIKDVTRQLDLKGITNGFDVVISALGKSVSPNDRNKTSFDEIDFRANSDILNEAVKSRCKKFIYISAFHSERYMHLEYFRVHEAFSETLINSGLNYSVIKPTAFFSAFLDVVAMAKKGRLFNLGKGDKLTNPIFEGDLAKICVDSMHSENAVIEAGGKQVYSRRRLNEIIQESLNPAKKLQTIPVWLMKMILPLIKIADRNTFDKFAFFVAVLQHDTIAPKIGEMTFEEYIHKHQGKQLH